MDFSQLIGPAVVAAGVSGVITIIGFFISASTAQKLHKERLAADELLAERKFKFDMELAERKLNLDAKLLDRKRQVELAECTLADFYQVRDIFTWVRHPVSFGEGKSRPREDDEASDEANLLDAFYVPVERIGRESELFARINASKPRFQANFGQEAGLPFDQIRIIKNRIISASVRLVSAQKARHPPRDTLIQKWEDTIWGGDDPDPIASEIEAAVATMEAICTPILRAEQQRA